MIELIDEEEKWLEIFSKNNEFFASLRVFFNKNDYLTEKQYEHLVKKINEYEEDGDLLLPPDVRIFKRKYRKK